VSPPRQRAHEGAAQGSQRLAAERQPGDGPAGVTDQERHVESQEHGEQRGRRGTFALSLHDTGTAVTTGQGHVPTLDQASPAAADPTLPLAHVSLAGGVVRAPTGGVVPAEAHGETGGEHEIEAQAVAQEHAIHLASGVGLPDRQGVLSAQGSTGESLEVLLEGRLSRRQHQEVILDHLVSFVGQQDGQRLWG